MNGLAERIAKLSTSVNRYESTLKEDVEELRAKEARLGKVPLPIPESVLRVSMSSY